MQKCEKNSIAKQRSHAYQVYRVSRLNMDHLPPVNMFLLLSLDEPNLVSPMAAVPSFYHF